jgi:hypothetical protein
MEMEPEQNGVTDGKEEHPGDRGIFIGWGTTLRLLVWCFLWSFFFSVIVANSGRTETPWLILLTRTAMPGVITVGAFLLSLFILTVLRARRPNLSWYAPHVVSLCSVIAVFALFILGVLAFLVFISMSLGQNFM